MLSCDSLINYSKRRDAARQPRGAARNISNPALSFTVSPAPKTCCFGRNRSSARLELPAFRKTWILTQNSCPGRLKALLDETARALSRQGFSVELKTGEKGAFDRRFALQGISSGLQSFRRCREKLRIKLEANRPGYPLRAEPRVVSVYGDMFPVPFASPGTMFAENILALLTRELGRDVYDIIFSSKKKWAPDTRIH